MAGDVEAVLLQAATLGKSLRALRRVVAVAKAHAEDVRYDAVPLRFRMEGTGQKVLQTVNTINRKLDAITTEIDARIEDLHDLEEALRS
jgi:hypothetical protein